MSRERKYELSKREVIDKWAKNYSRVMTWLSKVQRKENYAWFLWLYCKTVGKNPDELLALKVNPQNREAEFILDSFIAETKFSNSIKVGTMVAVRSFFRCNYADLAKESGKIEFVKQKPYRRHSKEELLKIYRSAQNPRDRALISFTWSTGIAKESLSKVQWKDLEADWEQQEIPHISLGSEKIKGHGLGKYRGVEQHTFLTPEAKKDLADYKSWLERVKGVKLKPENNIFLEVNAPYEPLGYNGLSKIAYQLSRWSGVPFSWHDSRRFVETALEETKINPNWARKIRGRKPRGEESPYSRPAIAQLRAAYKEAVPLLEFTAQAPTVPKEVAERLRQIEEEQREIKAKYYLRSAIKGSRRKPEKNCEDGEHCQLICKEESLADFLSKGWCVKAVLQSGSIVIDK